MLNVGNKSILTNINGVSSRSIELLKRLDKNTLKHSLSVMKLAVSFAKYLKFSEDELGILRFGALYHDIGKTLISEDILNKKGSLTDLEYMEVKTHTTKGYDLLSKTIKEPEILSMVLDHHEMYDGTGYPNHKGHNELSKFTRILTICDVYDVMINKRPYKVAYDIDYAIKELEDNANFQLDSKYVSDFLEFVYLTKKEEDKAIII